MHFSFNILAAFLAVTTAVAVPAPETSVSKRASAIPQAWEIAPASFEKIPEPQALHDKPQTSKDASKRDTDSVRRISPKTNPRLMFYSSAWKLDNLPSTGS